MISIRAFTALAIATARLILGPRARASDGGLTNPFVDAIAPGEIHPGGDACATNGFARIPDEGRPSCVSVVRFHTGGV